MTGSSRLLTVVFTDVVESTALRSRLGDIPVTAALRLHEDRVRRTVVAHRGRVVKSMGDGVLFAFASPGDAIACAVAIQDEQTRHNQDESAIRLAIRIGMTTGEVDDAGGDLHGQAVHAAARIVAKAKGGEILLAEVVRQLAGPIADVEYVDRGRVALRGLPDRWHLFAATWSRPGGSDAERGRPVARRASAGSGGVRTAALVGRRAELAQVDAALDRCASGQFRCVIVVGEAGVGKSSLAAAVLAHDSVLGLSARASPLGDTDSFGVWLEALDRHLRGLPPEEVLRLSGACVDDLAGVLPSVRAARGSSPAGEPPRSRLLPALASVLAGLAADQPLAVVVDDIHLADATSWESLGWFARNLSGHPILVVATARPVELRRNQAASAVVHGLEQDGCVETLALGGLDDTALTELVGHVLELAAPPPALVAWLAERSRGNPLFALGLLRALVEEGADLGAPRLRKFPEGLAERVAGRLAGLDEPSRATLETLAVLGSRVDVGDLVALSGRPLDRLAPLLDDLVEVGLVRAEERGRALIYEISHPLVEEAIYERIGPARRRALHRKVARELAELGRLGMAAPHYARSAEVGDPEAVAALSGAIRQAEDRELYREALVILGVLRDILPAGDDRWLEILDAMSWNAEWVVDHRADESALDGVEALREIMRLLEDSGDRLRLAGVQMRLASFLAWGAGDVEPARRLVLDALATFEAVGETGRALVARNELAWLAGMDGDGAQLVAAAGDVLALAQAADDRFVTMQALGMLALGRAQTGSLVAAEGHLRQSIAIAETDDKRYRLTWNLGFLAHVLANQGRMEEADALMDLLRADPLHVESLAVETFTSIQFMRGEFAAVLAVADDLMARHPHGLPRRRADAVTTAALAAVETDRVDAARRYLAVSTAVFGGRHWLNSTEQCERAAGMIAWHEGKLDEAIERLGRFATIEVESSYSPSAVIALLDVLEVCVERHDGRAVTTYRRQLEESAERCEGRLYAALAQLCRSAALAADEAFDRAGPMAEEAAEALAPLGCVPYQGRALALAGEAWAHADRDRATVLLGRAATAFEACGASWRQRRVVTQMGRLGTRGRRAAAAVLGPAGLSARERDVARLAAQGQTAKEIATALFIGERTVETHLVNAYAKLGVRSKQELRRRAGELDL